MPENNSNKASINKKTVKNKVSTPLLMQFFSTLPLNFRQKIILQAYQYLSEKGDDFKQSLSEDLKKLKVGLSSETQQTKEMLDIYLRQTQGKASKEEIKIAHTQFRDVMKGLGLGVLVVLPFSPITLPIIVRLGIKFGIQVLPNSFDFGKTPKEKV